MTRVLLAVLLTGCVEYSVYQEPPPPPADPPGDDLDIFGDPPADWDDCYEGLHGLYYNLLNTHPDVEPKDDVLPPVLDELDWWDDSQRTFRRYDPTTDFGPNWWPVDEGMPDDPQYFAVRWVGWLRVYGGSNPPVVLGAENDAWVLINDDIVLANPAADAFEPDTYTLPVGTGVHRIDVRYAHRAGLSNGFRFRIGSNQVKLCYPSYETE